MLELAASFVSRARARTVLALAALLAVGGAGCDNVTEKVGRVGDAAVRQAYMAKAGVETQANEKMDQPFDDAEQAARKKIEDASDVATGAASETIDGGVERAHEAAGDVAQEASRRVRFSTAGADDDFDSEWADEPAAE
jgi:vacuolar-type H+-ATPase subunit H